MAAARISHPRSSPHTPMRNSVRQDDYYRSNPPRKSLTSTLKISPYGGHDNTHPYGHYERPVNYEGPLDDVKQEIRASKDHHKLAGEEDDYSSASDSDGELDESPRHHKLKRLGVL